MSLSCGNYCRAFLFNCLRDTRCKIFKYISVGSLHARVRFFGSSSRIYVREQRRCRGISACSLETATSRLIVVVSRSRQTSRVCVAAKCFHFHSRFRDPRTERFADFGGPGRSRGIAKIQFPAQPTRKPDGKFGGSEFREIPRLRSNVNGQELGKSAAPRLARGNSSRELFRVSSVS